jgi:hypothetical protein
MLQAAGILFVILVVAGCSSGREYRYASPRPMPRYESYTRLILTPQPGFTMNRDRRGHYYHRSRGGLMYWQGRDNRFYLDRRQVHKVRYHRAEYREWQRYSRRMTR